MREHPISAGAMARLGWRRTDPQPRRKTTARWEHPSGWHLVHCGHPTAIWPWALYAPDGAMHCSGAVHGNPEHGKAWASLRAATEHVRSVLAGDAPAAVAT